MTIENIAQQFYDYSLYFKGYSPNTIRRYKYVIDFYQKVSQARLITDISTENLRNLFYYGRTQRKWSANTFIVFYKSLFVFIRWCITKGYLVTNPLSEIEKPRLQQTLPKKLSRQDAVYLLETVANYDWRDRFLQIRNHTIFAMFIHAGLRKTELVNLRVSDVDIENMTLFIRLGKGGKDRFVPISPGLEPILNQYITERKKKSRTCSQFFTSSTRDSGFTSDGLRHLVAKVQKEIGWKLSVHKLRHTFATLMIEGGCDIYSLSKMMGHSDIKTTTIYLAVSAEHLRSQIVKHPLNILTLVSPKS